MAASVARADWSSDLKVRQLLRGLPRPEQIAKARKIAALRKPADDLHRLLRRDYVRSLRRSLSYAQIRELVATFQRILPDFNSRTIEMMSKASCDAIAAKLGVTITTAPFGGPEGLALRGFYATSSPGLLRRPLIFVNTAHHLIVATTSFLHELGHHVSHQILDLPPRREHFYLDAGYIGQLTEPSELVADVAVSFAGYPKPVARRIFSGHWDWGLVARAARLPDTAFCAVQEHLRQAYGFDLYLEPAPADQRLQYLSGIIHYAKLRWALLAEYDI
jgi:hypothetical protein